MFSFEYTLAPSSGEIATRTFRWSESWGKAYQNAELDPLLVS